jgi:hypothetical protein
VPTSIGVWNFSSFTSSTRSEHEVVRLVLQGAASGLG